MVSNGPISVLSSHAKQIPLYSWFMIGWVGVMVATPFLDTLFAPDGRGWVATVGVLAQFGAVWAILVAYWGCAQTLKVTSIVLVGAWLAEYIGWQTGLLFGTYHYTEQLRPQVGGVPLIIPLAWMMMLPAAWAVADRILQGKRGLWFVLVTALAFTAWDLFLDPQMVAWGFWVWHKSGGYFGIPWHNFVGWLGVSGLLTVVVMPQKVPARPLILIYAMTWALETVGLILFWKLPYPALVGFVAMGCLLAWAWMRQK